MLYLSGSLPSKSETVDLLRSVNSGLMLQPNIGYSKDRTDGWRWAADNGCFNARWDKKIWLRWLINVSGDPRCLFAVVPDVVGDHGATLERWRIWWHVVHNLDYRPAFVCQDGCVVGEVPWTECGAVFLGGSTEFKLSGEAGAIVAEANRRGIWSHMGRVNSLKRLRIAEAMGCDSADGTYLAFGPDKNMPKLAGWLDQLGVARKK